MAKSKKLTLDRRNFLRSAAVVGAATLAAPLKEARPQQAAARPRDAVPLMSVATEAGSAAELDVLTTDRTGSDFMVDVIMPRGRSLTPTIWVRPLGARSR
jgi:choline dehydrogenase-like flavoprotein